MENDKRSVPRRWVKDLGADASYMLSILCELKLTEAEYPWENPEWFFLTTKDLALRFSLLKKTAVRDMLKKLKAKGVLLIKSGLRVAGKTLGYSVPDFVMKQWRCQEDRVRFNPADAQGCKCIARAMVLEVLCRNVVGNVSRKNRHAISRETGIPVSTVSDIIKGFKDKPEAYLQSLRARQLLPDDAGKLQPVREIGKGYRIKDAQGNVTYTRDAEVAKLALSS